MRPRCKECRGRGCCWCLHRDHVAKWLGNAYWCTACHNLAVQTTLRTAFVAGVVKGKQPSVDYWLQAPKMTKEEQQR